MNVNVNLVMATVTVTFMVIVTIMVTVTVTVSSQRFAYLDKSVFYLKGRKATTRNHRVRGV